MEPTISLQGMTDKECRDLMLKNAAPYVRWYYFDGYATGIKAIGQYQCMSIDVPSRKDLCRAQYDRQKKNALFVLDAFKDRMVFDERTACAFGILAALADFEYVLEYP